MKLRQMQSRRIEESASSVPYIHRGPVKRKASNPGAKEDYVRMKMAAMRVDDEHRK